MGQQTVEGIGLKAEEMKTRILNYLEYLSEKDLQEISVEMYNLSKRRRDVRIKKEYNEKRERESSAN
tara:strand:- start:198 stop:398 length:201 start_codon:yes stop_codon:yes gene_type:complete